MYKQGFLTFCCHSPVPQYPGKAQRKSAIKTPKVEKIKVERRKKKQLEVGENKEKGPPRKRKKIEPVAATGEPEHSAEGLLPGQSGPVTTIGKPCLTIGETPPVVKPKKVRVKKVSVLEPKPHKIAKMDIDTKPNDDDNNINDGDDSSTAGNEGANYFNTGNYCKIVTYFSPRCSYNPMIINSNPMAFLMDESFGTNLIRPSLFLVQVTLLEGG